VPRGGNRSGAGRKPGSRTEKTHKVAKRAAQEGTTPLELMLRVMREYDDAGESDKAVSIAKDAAPYMHPRLAAVQHTGKGGAPLTITEVIVIRPVAALPAPESEPST
jgi:hypothetical protein